MNEDLERPIRVLHVVSKMDRAGLESRIMEIYRCIDRKKVQFDFYTYSDEKGFFDDEIKKLGGKVYYGDKSGIRHIITMTTNMKMFLKKHNEYSIIHCHMNQWCGIILKGARQAGVPVRIAHSRTALKVNSIKNLVKNIIRLSANSEATDRFAVSEKAAHWLFGKKNVKIQNVRIWPNAIDCSKFSFNSDIRNTVRKELNIEDNLVFMHVGNIKPEKNHSFLLDIFSEVKKIRQNVKLVVVGQDYMNGRIQNEAEEKGIKSETLFLGAQTNVNELLQAADLFVFPSIYEGFPGAVLEAEASGLPCLISDTITEEVCLTDNIVRFPLNNSAQEWATKALNMYSGDRKSNEGKIIDEGYDIRKLSKDMCEYYLSKIKNS